MITSPYLWIIRAALGEHPKPGELARFRLLLAARLPDFLAELAQEARKNPEKPAREAKTTHRRKSERKRAASVSSGFGDLGV